MPTNNRMTSQAMLSLFYLPSILYNIVYNYLNRHNHEELSQKQLKGIQSKYSSDNVAKTTEQTKSGLKKEVGQSGISKNQSIRAEAGSSPALQTEHPVVEAISTEDHINQLSSDEELMVVQQNFPTHPYPENPLSLSSEHQNIPPSLPDVHVSTITQSYSPRKPDVIVALSASSSDSEYEEFFPSVKSVKPPVKLEVSAGSVSASYSLQQSAELNQPIIDNSHVIIEDDDVDEDGDDEDDNFPPISQNIPTNQIVPNSFANISQPPPSSTKNSDGRSSSTPDTELPSYNGELEQLSTQVYSPMSEGKDTAGKLVKFEDESKNIDSSESGIVSGNAAAASSDGSEVWGDVPVETSSLTSQKRELFWQESLIASCLTILSVCFSFPASI